MNLFMDIIKKYREIIYDSIKDYDDISKCNFMN